MRSPPPLRLFSMALRRDLSTIDWPSEVLKREGPDKGVPVFDAASCSACGECVPTCPATCISLDEGWTLPVVDAGACVRCGRCAVACGEGAVSLTREDELAVYSREDLVMDGTPTKEVDVGPPPSHLYRLFVRGKGKAMVEPSRLLEERSSALLRRRNRPDG